MVRPAPLSFFLSHTDVTCKGTPRCSRAFCLHQEEEQMEAGGEREDREEQQHRPSTVVR